MKIIDLEKIRIGKYRVEILKKVRSDDFSQLLGSFNSVYLCSNYFDADLQRLRNIRFQGNAAIQKKNQIIAAIPHCVKTISFSYTRKYSLFKFYNVHNKEKIINLPVFNIGKLTRIIWGALITIIYLVKKRKSFENIVFYNIYPHTVFPAIFMKIFYSKKIYLDFEDDYRIIKPHSFYSLLTTLTLPFLNGVILINESMKLKLGNKLKSIVFNGKADFGYVDKKVEKEINDIKIIYSGNFDRLRGASLLNDFIKAMKKNKIKFSLVITGFGELAGEMKKLDNHYNVFYKGFIKELELKALLKDSDVGLVLQPPNYPINQVTFPSKVFLYAENKVVVLRLIKNNRY